LIEAILIAPLEYIVPTQWYKKINRFIMSSLFFVPLMAIALFESTVHNSQSKRLQSYFNGPVPEEEGDPEIEDPECNEDDGGEISKIKFADLVKVFPK
jgi:hypothetical protein